MNAKRIIPEPDRELVQFNTQLPRWLATEVRVEAAKRQQSLREISTDAFMGHLRIDPQDIGAGEN